VVIAKAKSQSILKNDLLKIFHSDTEEETSKR